MVIDCPEMEVYRSSCNVGSFIKAVRFTRPGTSSVKLYAMYLSDRNSEMFCKKYKDLLHMYLGWHNLMGIDIM